MNKIYGIGVGPGDPELMTIKALNLIKKSNIIILPSSPKEDCYAYKIVKSIYPEIDSKTILCKPFPMTKDKEILAKAHQEIYSEVKAYILSGENVAFLTIGDSCIYSTYSYISALAKNDNIETEFINGIPSFSAVAARLNISLADGNEEIHIIPANYNLEHTSTFTGTRIFMKSGKQLQTLIDFLAKESETKNLSIYGVSNCGLPNEKIMLGLEEIKSSSYLTVIIVKELLP